MSNLVNAIIVGVIVGVLVGLLCVLLGQVSRLGFLATYATLIGLVAGILAFLSRWDRNHPVV